MDLPRSTVFIAAGVSLVIGWSAGFFMHGGSGSSSASLDGGTQRSGGSGASDSGHSRFASRVSAAGDVSPERDAAADAPPVEGDFDVTVRAALSLTDDTDRVVRLREIARGIDPEDLPAAAEQARRLPMGERYQVLQALGARWAESDAPAAAAYALQTTGTRWGYNPLLNAVLEKWATTDLQGVGRFLNELPGARRNSVMSYVVNSLSRRDPQAALVLLDSQPGGKQMEYEHQQIFQQWAQRDPAGAAAAAQNLPSGRIRDGSLQGVAAAWANENPAAAIAWTETFPDTTMRSKLLYSVAEAWADSDPKAALAWGRSLPDAQMRQQIVGGTLARIAQTDANEAQAQLRALPQGQERENLVNQVVNTLIRQDAKVAITFLDLLPEGRVRDSTTANLVMQMSRTDAKAAGELFMMLPPSLMIERASQLANAMAVGDVDSALAWAKALPEGQTRKNALNGVCGSWAQHDPKGAAEWMLKEMPGADISSVLGNWSATAPRDVLAWARTLDNEDTRRGAMASVVQTLMRSNAAEARSVFMADLTPEAQAAAAPGLAENLARRDLAGTRAWAEALPPGAARDGAMAGLVREWSAQDPVAAAAWVEKLPAGEGRDTVVTQFAGSLMRREPETAIAWASSIAEPQLRSTQLEQLATRWMQTDAAAARQWISQTDSLGETAKRRIMNQRPVPGNYYNPYGGGVYYSF